MSSLTIISLPKKGEISEWIVKELLGLEIGLCSPQNIFCIGFTKSTQNIADMHNALAVSPEGIISSLKIAGKKKVAAWFDEKYKCRHIDPNGDIILISTTCCRYNP